MSKLNLTVSEIQGHLRQIHESRQDLTAEERYSLTSAIEALELVKLLGPGLQRIVREKRKHIGANE